MFIMTEACVEKNAEVNVVKSANSHYQDPWLETQHKM